MIGANARSAAAGAYRLRAADLSELAGLCREDGHHAMARVYARAAAALRAAAESELLDPQPAGLPAGQRRA